MSGRLECLACKTVFSINDGIIVLMPQRKLNQQAQELELREKVAQGYADFDSEKILEIISQHHCLPVMSKRAGMFRAKFDTSQWLLDAGCGSGWCWRNTKGGNLVLLDFVFSNLKSAKRLLEGQSGILFIQADAACLPIKNDSLSAVWSVQVTQHFPESIMSVFLKELKRTLKKDFMAQIYNLNPALFLRLFYALRGRRFHLKGNNGKMLVNRLSAKELLTIWNDFGGKRLRIGYSELFFHPDLRLKSKGRYIAVFEDFFNLIPWLSGLFARQIQVVIF